MRIPFNKPYMTGKELWYISQAHHNSQLSGDGPFTKEVHSILEKLTGTSKALLTHSCTGALEMSAILADIEPGDEVILPSFTFVSTANAFALRGARLVFVDIREDTLNLDENLLEEAITEKTRAIVPVHYAGVACEMDTIIDIANRYNLLVVEDAAQGVGAFYKNRALGTIGQMGTYSFHETKNITSGEGGALLINDKRFMERAEIIREKGTNRSKFFRGQVDKYTWVDMGSSYLPGEIVAAFLKAQLEEVDFINQKRKEIWNHYNNGLHDLEKKGYLRRPVIPGYAEHNAHMYYIIVNTEEIRDSLIHWLMEKEIVSVFHYLPLHKSDYGQKLGYSESNLKFTELMSSRIIRLPMYTELSMENVDRVIDEINKYYNKL